MEYLKKVLIIGGSSSICDEAVEHLEHNGYSIDLMTYRSEKNKKNIKNFSQYNWKHLDLLDQKSTELLIEELKDDYYDLIWCVPTYPSGQRDPIATTRDYLEELYGSFLVNYIDLIRNLAFKKLKNEGKMVYQSSEAANVPTDMQDYVSAKSAIQSYVISLSKKLKNKTIFVIATTGIYESLSYYQHGADYYKEDPKRWVTKKEIAEILVRSKQKDTGKIFTLGFCPTKTEVISRYAGIIYPYNYTEWSQNDWYDIPNMQEQSVVDVLGNHTNI